VILLRILAGLYLFRESLIIHTAADRALPRAVFEELVTAIEDVPELRAEVHKVRLANGTEELTLKGGRSYRIVAPRQDAVRGWSVDTFIVDEAREQRDDAMLSAGLYMMRAVPNPQLWIVSNAGDPDSVVLRRYRDRGLAAIEDPASDPEMCLVEYSTDRDPEDPNGWIEANPALGISIDAPTLLEELRSDDPQSFRTEALCQWVETATATAVPLDSWLRCGVDELRLDEPPLDARVMMGIDIDPARLEAAIVLGVTYPPDPETGEVPPLVVGVAQRWITETGVDEAEIAAAVEEWAGLWNPEAIGFDPYTCAGLVERLPAETYPTEPIAGVKWVNACAALWDVVVNETLQHGSDAYLDAQIASAGRRDVGDGSFRIARLNSAIAIPAVMALARTVYLSLRPRTTYEIL
jgi:phage terminase large subunit-like protein